MPRTPEPWRASARRGGHQRAPDPTAPHSLRGCAGASPPGVPRDSRAPTCASHTRRRGPVRASASGTPSRIRCTTARPLRRRVAWPWWIRPLPSPQRCRPSPRRSRTSRPMDRRDRCLVGRIGSRGRTMRAARETERCRASANRARGGTCSPAQPRGRSARYRRPDRQCSRPHIARSGSLLPRKGCSALRSSCP
jgi:hypothetical protein